MKKFIFTFLFILCIESLTTPSSNIHKTYVGYATVLSHREHAIKASTEIFTLNEIVLYIIDTCLEENVNPLEMLAIIKIENPKLDPFAVNQNVAYKKIYDKRKNKYIKKKIIVSYDTGIGQLNSKYLTEYEWFYWTKKGEVEKFDPENYKHNIKIAIRLFKTLERELKNESSAVMAYNAGIGRVMNNQIPLKTLYFYLPQYLNNLEKMGASR